MNNKGLKPDSNQGRVHSEAEKEKITSKEAQLISPNTLIESRVHYKTCDDLIIDREKAASSIVNMDKDEFEKSFTDLYPTSRIISFSPEKIVLWTEKDHLCTNHYIIGEEDGFIAVYKIDNKGDRVVKNIFHDYSIDLLVEMDKNKIKKGIIVDSEEELSDILENFIS